MRIASSTVVLSSSHTYARTETSLTRMRVAIGGAALRPGEVSTRAVSATSTRVGSLQAGWAASRTLPSDGADAGPRVGPMPPGLSGRDAPPGQGRGLGVLERGAPGLALGLRGVPAPAPAPVDPTVTASDEDEAAGLDANLRAAIAIVERLTGRKVEVLRPSDLDGGAPPPDPAVVSDPPTTPVAGEPAVAQPAVTVTLEHYQRIDEAEHTTVSAAATVTAADGTTREVELELAMSRRFVEEHLLGAEVVVGGAPVDPLVITLAPQMATFGSGLARFDLDLDGVADEVRLTAGHSAYLVDDHDGDGAITDGSELFGPTTGDGFAELAALDEDGNGWIDAGDAAYHRLRLAVADGSGQITLRGLAEAGVEALGISSVASPFQVTDGADVLGQVRATGLALLSGGRVGTVQHVDLLL